MPDFTRPKIRLHTVNIREQFVAPLMDGKLKAITRLNGRGYNAGDCIRFSVLPMQSSDVQFFVTTEGERETLQNRFYEITFVMYGKGLKEGYVTLSLELVRERKTLEPCDSKSTGRGRPSRNSQIRSMPMLISSTPPIPRVMIPSIRNVMLSPAWTASPR